MCARKCASLGGDIRNSFSLLSIAIDEFLHFYKSLDDTNDKENLPPSDTEVPIQISEKFILKAFENMNGHSKKNILGNEVTSFSLPSQQQILYKYYLRVTKEIQIDCLDISDFKSSCEILDSHGMIICDKKQLKNLKVSKCLNDKILDFIPSHLKDLFAL
ncbi:MAG: AAA ATPase [Paramarteilia canceri]